MDKYIPTREDAYKLLTEHVKDESLISHSLMVESVMRHFANLYGEDEEKWGVIEPIHPMEKVIYTIDELTGLIYATAIVRPSKSLYDLKVKSVRKKWKTSSFAAAIRRDVIAKGAQLMDMELSKLIEETIEGMKLVSEEIGLNGEG